MVSAECPYGLVGFVMLNVGCGMLNESFGCRTWHVQSERSVKI